MPLSLSITRMLQYISRRLLALLSSAHQVLSAFADSYFRDSLFEDETPVFPAAVRATRCAFAKGIWTSLSVETH